MRHAAIVPGVLLTLAGVALAQPMAEGPVVRYDGHRLVRVQLHGARDIQTVFALGGDQWSHRLQDGPNDFAFSPEAFEALRASGIPFEILNNNIQDAIDAENARLRAPGQGRGWYDDFKNLAAIETQLNALAAGYPGLATVVNLGNSLQNRPIKGLRIANDAIGTPACEPTILYNACQHAREWISPMVAMYAAEQFLATYATNGDVRYLVDHAEILIIPVTNPDGYTYTWTNDRYWRKNRRNNGDGTTGVDLNRNWGYQWGLNNGSDSWGGSEIYRGTTPFSEPETQRLRDWAASRPALVASVDLHSYGQYILWPWGYTSQLPPDNATFQSLGTELKNVIKSFYNRTYTTGPIYNTLYPASGVHTDYFWGTETAHAFTIELRGNDFVVPPSEIIPNSIEVYGALRHFALWALDRNPPQADFNLDGSINTLDVLSFLNAWSAGNSSADVNHDGSVNTLDVLTFLNLWNQQC